MKIGLVRNNTCQCCHVYVCISFQAVCVVPKIEAFEKFVIINRIEANELSAYAQVLSDLFVDGWKRT